MNEEHPHEPLQTNTLERTQFESIRASLALTVHVVAKCKHHLKENKTMSECDTASMEMNLEKSFELVAGHDRLGCRDKRLSLLQRENPRSNTNKGIQCKEDVPQ